MKLAALLLLAFGTALGGDDPEVVRHAACGCQKVVVGLLVLIIVGAVLQRYQYFFDFVRPARFYQ